MSADGRVGGVGADAAERAAGRAAGRAGGKGSSRPAKALRATLGTLVTIVTTLLGLLLVTFLIGRVMPIDPVIAVVGERASKALYEATRLEMGLDRPLLVQFGLYIGDVLQGDFGKSLLTARPVIDDILRVFPATLELATLGTLIGVLVGVPLGVVAAVKRDTWIDQVARVVALVGYSMPIFWLGLVGLLVFYGMLGWVGGPGRVGIFYVDVVPVVTGMILVDSRARRAVGGVPRRDQPHRAAGDAARLLQPRLHQSHDALVHARAARLGVHHDRARQGRPRAGGDLAPRLRQHPRAAADRHRAELRGSARRLGADRDHLRLAGHRLLHHDGRCCRPT